MTPTPDLASAVAAGAPLKGPAAGTIGAWGGGAGLLGIAVYASTLLSGFTDDIKTAQSEMQLRMQEIGSDVKTMSKAVQKLEVRSDKAVTESQMRDFVRLKLLEYEQSRSK
jgi:outer membrane murein-binding lipoprotein Lpp